MTTCRAETTAVKHALEAAGYVGIQVSHGTGTAGNWLNVSASLKPGQGLKEHHRDLIRIAQAVTGRSGDYHGRITA